MQRSFVALAVVVVTVALLGSVGTARAEPDKFSPPELRGYVVDETHTLSPAQVERLDRRLEAFHREYGYAIVALLLPSLQGMTIEDVAYQTFNTWQIGDKGKDNGVLLVIAPAERRMRIETGKGVGGELTDLESAEILRNRVGPALAAGELARALEDGTAAIEEALTGDLPTSGVQTPPTDQPRAPPLSPRSILVIAVIVVLAGVLAVVSPAFRMVLFAFIWSFLRGGGGLGRGGGGSGGGPGGGGRSGGGGASGSY